jgi:hypothetical protein
MLSVETLVDGQRELSVLYTPWIVAVDRRGENESLVTLSTGERRLVFVPWARLRRALSVLRDQTLSLLPGEDDLT